MPEAHLRRSLLFITRIPPGNGGGGSQVYSFDVLTNLAAQGFEVSVLLLEPCLLDGRLPWIFEKLSGTPFRQICPGYFKFGQRLWHPKGICLAIRRKLSQRLTFFKQPPAPPAATWGNELSPAEMAWVRAARSLQRWDVVVCNYGWLAGALPLFDANVRKAILTHDVWHNHIARRSDNVFLQKLDRAAEQKFLEQADIVIAINETDARIFREMLPSRIVVCAPMSCTPHFSDQTPTPGRLLFVGSDYQPNVDGVTWFLNEVKPILGQKASGRIQLNLVGAVGPALKNCKPDVFWKAKGKVKDLTPEYIEAEIVIVPLLSGTGLKIKLVEAFAHGKAIVTTTVGAQGLERLAGSAFIIADTAEEFAAAILNISNDRETRVRLETAARQVALTDFSPATCCAELGRCLAGEKSAIG